MRKMGKMGKNLPKVGLTSLRFQSLKISIVLKRVGNMASKIITIPRGIPRVQKLTISKTQWTQLNER